MIKAVKTNARGMYIAQALMLNGITEYHFDDETSRNFISRWDLHSQIWNILMSFKFRKVR